MMRSLAFLAMLIFCHLTMADGFYNRLVEAAKSRTNQSVVYDGRYVRIPYPGGDVPENIGVCTDVVIRSYRSVGIDLQKVIHQDMKRHFAKYPKLWGLKTPDSNIDHRRVPNLQTYFKRHGAALPVSNNPNRYKPGDLVTWVVDGNRPHIGIVVDQRSADGKRPLIVHNIGEGPKMEDMLMRYPITGHYRFGEKLLHRVTREN